MSLDLISGDNHIDLTYCPPDLWSSAAPAQWRSRVPHTIEREDGLHWLVDGKDKGLWNAVGPSFAPHRPGLLARIDAMHEAGFRWDHRPGAIARPTTPELRIADLDRDGQQAEFVYGCLMLGEMIADPKLRSWCGATYNDWAVDFARRADPTRIFPLAVIPNHDPEAAAREVRRCAGMGMKGGDLAFKRISPPLWHKSWDTLWRAAAECRFPISFHSTGMPGLRGGDTPQMNKEYYPHIRLVRTALFQLDSMEVLASIL
ncbi:MAG TPA: amidohydrolase family protein, partial [Verrucomicrobiae bacterium]|nr:amidohydrolase family protein [Verrucomicrobiae bacterium]